MVADRLDFSVANRTNTPCPNVGTRTPIAHSTIDAGAGASGRARSASPAPLFPERTLTDDERRAGIGAQSLRGVPVRYDGHDRKSYQTNNGQRYKRHSRWRWTRILTTVARAWE